MKPIIKPPKVRVLMDGAPLPPEDTEALGEVRVQQRLSLPTLCELVFFEPVGRMANTGLIRPGLSLQVTVEGYDQALFCGQITAIVDDYGPSHGREIRVRGYDLLHQLRKRQPVRTHTQRTLVELVSELVKDSGLSVQSEHPGILRQQLVQFRESDLELMTRAAERCGLYFTLRDEVVHLLSLAGLGSAIPLALGTSLLESRFEINADTACLSAVAVGWDPWCAQPHEGAATKPRVGRHRAAASPLQLGGNGKRALMGETVNTAEEATAIAQAELDSQTAREVTLWGVAEGNPALQPGTPIKVSGVADSLVGPYVLTAVTHLIDPQRGFVSEISTSPPVLRERPWGTITSLGVVSRVDDPDSLARVRVSLPSYGDLESEWLQVVIPGAGPGKGILALPDVGDRVLVLHPRGDPAQGVVLGGLYGSQELPENVVEDGAVHRFTLLTSAGQRLCLDQADQTISVENGNGEMLQLSPQAARLSDALGSSVELSKECLKIHSETDLVIQAPGNAITIKGERIDFERA